MRCTDNRKKYQMANGSNDSKDLDLNLENCIVYYPFANTYKDKLYVISYKLYAIRAIRYKLYV